MAHIHVTGTNSVGRIFNLCAGVGYPLHTITAGAFNFHVTEEELRSGLQNQLESVVQSNSSTFSFRVLRDDSVDGDKIMQSLLEEVPVRAVRAATTGSIANLSAALVVQDGVTLVQGDRVLVKNTASPDGVIALHGKYNGIYVVGPVSLAGTAPLTRAEDFNESAEVKAGDQVSVAEGTVNADQIFQLTTNNPIVLGTTALTFAAGPASIGYAQLMPNIFGTSQTLAAAGAIDLTHRTSFIAAAAGPSAYTLADSTETGQRKTIVLNVNGAPTTRWATVTGTGLAGVILRAIGETLEVEWTGATWVDITEVVSYNKLAASIYGDQQDLTTGAAPVAVDLVHRDTLITSGGTGAEGCTLANGLYDGQRKSIILKTLGAPGDVVTLTPTSGAIWTFATTEDSVELVWSTSATAWLRVGGSCQGLVADVAAVAAAAAAGTSTRVARADHAHAHGNQLGGALHADAVAGGAAGFLTGADKTKLDALPAATLWRGQPSAARLYLHTIPTATDPVNIGASAAGEFRFMANGGLLAAQVYTQVELSNPPVLATDQQSLIDAINGTPNAHVVEAQVPFAETVVADLVAADYIRLRSAAARGGAVAAGPLALALAETLTDIADVWSAANLNVSGESATPPNQTTGDFVITAEMIAAGYFDLEFLFTPATFLLSTRAAAGGAVVRDENVTIVGDALHFTFAGAGAPDWQAGDIVSYVVRA